MQKYLSDTASEYEKKELADLLNILPDGDLDEALILYWEGLTVTRQLDKESSARILTGIVGKKKSAHRLYLLTAAAAVLITCIIVRQLMVPEQKTSRFVAAVKNSAPKNFDRHIMLPDSSIVVLKSGSTLRIGGFKNAERKVELIGEAYFEITKDNRRPFVIIAGKVKTTVLGTAFDIRAWPAEKKVIVSVTSGKVKVEDHKKVLALLTANQQVKYDIVNSDYSQNKVDAGKVVADWASKDLIFKGETMSEIVAALSKRYDVDITITDPDVAATQIVSAFEATEPLDSILDIICSLNNNARFKHEGDQIIISHK